MYTLVETPTFAARQIEYGRNRSDWSSLRGSRQIPTREQSFLKVAGAAKFVGPDRGPVRVAGFGSYTLSAFHQARFGCCSSTQSQSGTLSLDVSWRQFARNWKMA